MDFDIAAASWDTPRRVERARIVAAQICAALCPQPHWHALELGCGTGLISFFLADRFAHVTLVDSSQGMIDALGKKIRQSGRGDMEPLCLDLTCGRWRGGALQAIYSSMALHHIRDTGGLLKKLRDLLAPGGRLCIVDLDRVSLEFHREEPDFAGHQGFSHDVLRREMESAGLREVEIHTFYSGEKQAGGKSVPYSLFCAVARHPEPVQNQG